MVLLSMFGVSTLDLDLPCLLPLYPFRPGNVGWLGKGLIPGPKPSLWPSWSLLLGLQIPGPQPFVLSFATSSLVSA